MEEAENTTENLLTVLAGLNVEAGEAIKRALILTEQLKKASLSLILLKEKKVTGASGNECIICRLIAP